MTTRNSTDIVFRASTRRQKRTPPGYAYSLFCFAPSRFRPQNAQRCFLDPVREGEYDLQSDP
jgi:hypothetical protein